MEPSHNQPEHADLPPAKPSLPADGSSSPSSAAAVASSSPPPAPAPAPAPAPTPAPASAPAPAPSTEGGDAIPASSQQVEPTPSSAPAAVSADGVQEALPESLSTETSAVQSVLSQLDNLTIFGNKSLEELHQIQSKRSHLSAGILFSDPSLRIPPPILESLTLEMRFEKPSEIQASTLPIIIGGHNLIAQAQSGAGKTIAFVIGMLTMVDTHMNRLQALCLTPTRELANQILQDAVRPLSTRIPNLRMEDALPGREIPDGAVCTSHLVVGTPGTVKRWITKGYLRMDSVRIFVLDEADKMVEEKSLGAETIAIRNKLRPEAQLLLFSATYTPEIIAFARKIVPRAYLVTPRSTEELVLDVIFQVRMDVSKCPGGKLQVLKDIYDFMTLQQSIVFVERKMEAEAVARMMRDSGFEVSTLHGELQPMDRDRVMDDFRAGRTKVLITTNALARGVDVPAVAVVVNYDLPVQRVGSKLVADEATYLHRIGRCGRFGRRGTAISFLEKPGDFMILDAIENYFSPGKRMTADWNPNDIEGLSDSIRARPAGGEIQPAAKEGNTQVSISLFK